MIEPIYIENESLLIHSFGPQEMRRMENIAADVYSILSDDVTLTFLPEKRLRSVGEAETLLKGSLLNFHAGKNYLHFISDKKTDKIIGLIDIIPPSTARQHYKLNDYPYFIEFYLKASAAKKKIMSSMLPLFIDKVRGQKIKQLAAITNRENVGAKKVLHSSGFEFKGDFDAMQDFYTITFN